MSKIQILGLAQFIVITFSIASAYRNDDVINESRKYYPDCDSLLRKAKIVILELDSITNDLKYQIEKKDLIIDQLSIRLNDEVSKNININKIKTDK